MLTNTRTEDDTMNWRILGKSPSAWWQLRFLLLVCAHLAICCVSLIYVADIVPAIIAFDKSHMLPAIIGVLCFALVSVVFVIAPFSFGYFLGFYFYTMVFGYLWWVNFSLLNYDHRLAVVSICLSALAFLAPALFITSPISQRFELTT